MAIYLFEEVMKKYKINKIKESEITKLKKNLEVFFAKVDPEYLSQLSEMIGKPLTDDKDTEDYNFNLISSLVDRTAQLFMEGGQKGIQEGDILAVSEKLGEMDGSESAKVQELLEAIVDGDYKKYPFSIRVVQELRARFLLQTEKSDTFKGLMAEVDEHIGKYLDKDSWERIKTAIQKGGERIKKEDLDFIDPPEGMEQGDLIPLTDAEAATYGINTGVMVDKRKDGHDLLSLKELVNILKGNPVNHLSIGPGFFLKYMPELHEVDIDTIVFKVVDNKLEEIKVQKIYQADKAAYSPISSGIGLLKTYGSEHGFFDKTFGKGTAKERVKKRFKFVEFYDADKIVDEKTKYYVCVDGHIAAPETSTPLGYEKPSHNTKIVDAGETFLYEKQNGEIMCTRLYFMPYKMTEINPVLQTGSVVWGSNDQSLHSCVRGMTSYASFIADQMKDVWNETNERYSEAVTAAKVNHFIADNPEEIFAGGPWAQTEEEIAREMVLAKACLSVLEVTPFTLNFFLKIINHAQPQYGAIHTREALKPYLKNYAPLTKRFLIKKYFETKNGLTLEYQPTYYATLSNEFKRNRGTKLMHEIGMWERVQELVEKGSTYEDAIKEIYPEDLAKEKIRNLK